MESKMTGMRLALAVFLFALAAAGILFSERVSAQGEARGEGRGDGSDMTLRKSVKTRQFQGTEIEGEERIIGRGDSLWRILVQEKGIPENRFQSHLVFIRGLNPHLKDVNVLLIGDAVFIPLRLEDGAAAQAATAGDVTAATRTPGAIINYRVKAGEHLLQILRQRLGALNETQLAHYFALTRDLNPERKNWDLLQEGDLVRLPVPANAPETAHGQAPATRDGQAAAQSADMNRVRRAPARENLALLSRIVETLGNQVQGAGEETVALKDGALRIDKASYPVVFNPMLQQKVVIDPGNKIPSSLRAKLADAAVAMPVMAFTDGLSLQDAVSQLISRLGFQTLPPERPVVIQESGVTYEATGAWTALAPEESNKAQEIYVINLTDRPGSIPEYLTARLAEQGLRLREVALAAGQPSSAAPPKNEPKGVIARVRSWPADKREIVDSLLITYGIPFGVAETLSVAVRDGLSADARADRVFELSGKRVAVFFQSADPEIKKALHEKQSMEIVELDLASLSSREIIGRLLQEMGERESYREHRFSAAAGAMQDRLIVRTSGFYLPHRSMFVTDREIPPALHRFFFDKGLEIVYFR